MTRIFAEVQYDPAASEVRMSATTGFGEQSYRVACTASDEKEAVRKWAEFIHMYRRSGATVVTNGGKVFEPLVEVAT